eukprot:scaffold16039_cov46-Attheya_sp.AAC.1
MSSPPMAGGCDSSDSLSVRREGIVSVMFAAAALGGCDNGCRRWAGILWGLVLLIGHWHAFDLSGL